MALCVYVWQNVLDQEANASIFSSEVKVTLKNKKKHCHLGKFSAQ